MKTKILTLALFAFLFANETQAQDVTTVNAKNSDISDNLDLRAVASIFGDSENLEDFERRLNDPKNQISNLDLNYDRQVDYLRVIEAAEGNTRLIVLQAVLERDVFQDVATIEVERDRNNNVQVQVVGDVYMYGQNYIYEPVYVTRPAIFSIFWVSHYRPYYSPWYWGYYPTYYYGWAPYPVYRYRNHVHVHIHNYNQYNYVNVRRSERAVAMHSTRRSNGYERQHPNRSFTQRNNNVSNRYELDKTRNVAGTRNPGVRSTTGNGRNSNSAVSTRNTQTRSNSGTVATRGNKNAPSTRSQSVQVRNTPTRAASGESVSTRNNGAVRNESAQKTRSTQRDVAQKTTRGNAEQRTPSVQTRNTPTRSETRSAPVQQRTKAESGNSRGGNSSNSRGNGRG